MLRIEHYRSIFISDIHLGTRGCKAEQLCDFLAHTHCDFLYLVGDIIDGWKLGKRVFWPQSHTDVVMRILAKAKQGIKVIYIVGNHDEMLRKWLDLGLSFGNISIQDEIIHKTAAQQSYIVVHGDLFDGVTRIAPWLAWAGDSVYQFFMLLNHLLNKLRGLFGLSYWSMSKFLKHNVKRAVRFIFKFEKNLAEYAKSHGCDGVICGHIHTPEMKMIEGIQYINDGDWVESCTALVEHDDGRMELIDWGKKRLEEQ